MLVVHELDRAEKIKHDLCFSGCPSPSPDSSGFSPFPLSGNVENDKNFPF